MDFLKAIGPYVGVVVGWLLGQASQLLTVRRHRTGAIGLALADLLEIRHRILGTKFIEEYLFRLAAPPVEAVLQWRQFADAALPAMAGLSDRYNSAVSIIAETHPLLAFRLRSKDAITQYLTTLRAAAAGDPDAVEPFGDLEETLRPTVIEALEDSIVELARAHSVRTRFGVRKLLREGLDVPENAKPLFAMLQAAVKQ